MILGAFSGFMQLSVCVPDLKPIKLTDAHRSCNGLATGGVFLFQNHIRAIFHANKEVYWI